MFCDVAARRSARLIKSPWVYNWPKKAPIYINIDSDSTTLGERQHKKMSNRGTEQGNKLQFEVGDASGSNNVVRHGSLDVRSEWGIGKVIHGPVLTDDDDDFVTPDEHFGKSKTVKLHGTRDKTKKPKCVGLANEEAEKPGKKRKRESKVICSAMYVYYCFHAVVIMTYVFLQGKTYVDKGIGRRGKQTAYVDGRKIVISKAAMKASDEGNEATPSKIEKPKKVRSYEGYLQKKFLLLL